MRRERRGREVLRVGEVEVVGRREGSLGSVVGGRTTPPEKLPQGSRLLEPGRAVVSVTETVVVR